MIHEVVGSNMDVDCGVVVEYCCVHQILTLMLIFFPRKTPFIYENILVWQFFTLMKNNSFFVVAVGGA